MKIALIGGTGFVGKAVLEELLGRGHTVTALARDPAKYAPRDGVTAVLADVTSGAQVERAVAGHDAVISAYNPGWTAPALYDDFMAGTRGVLAGVKAAGVKRLLVVGGAGSLFVAPGVQLMDTPEFKELVPASILPGVRAARDALTLIQGEAALDWTFLSPAAALVPGERTGRFRIGADDVLMTVDGQPAGISVADLAVAIVDEIETPAHIRRRFTVAY